MTKLFVGLDVQDELNQIANAANEDANRSIQDVHNQSLDLGDFDKISAMSQEEEQSERKSEASNMSAALSMQGVDTGFELSLTGMDLKDLAFLTKFMTQFKKIKNIDMGETKL